MIDTHCHITEIKFIENFLRYLHDSNSYAIGVTNIPSAFQMIYKMRKKIPNIRPALGMHPLLVLKYQNELDLFKKLIDKTSYIGEIGLDYSKASESEKRIQLKFLDEIFTITKDKHKVYSIHSRNADEDVLKLIDHYKMTGIILHWFTGNILSLEKAISLGCYFSINAKMIFSPKGQKIISKIPLSKILIESDAPFANSSSLESYQNNLESVYKFLANLHCVNHSTLEKLLSKNFKSIVSNIY